MDRARQTWELTQQLLADDPELDPAVLAVAQLSAAAIPGRRRGYGRDW